MCKCTILRILWYLSLFLFGNRNYSIFFLQCNPGIGLSCFPPFFSSCSIFYYPYLLFNSNFKFQLPTLDILLTVEGKNSKKSTQKCSLFFYPLFSFARLLKFVFTLRSYPSKPSCSIILLYI